MNGPYRPGDVITAQVAAGENISSIAKSTFIKISGGTVTDITSSVSLTVTGTETKECVVKWTPSSGYAPGDVVSGTVVVTLATSGAQPPVPLHGPLVLVQHSATSIPAGSAGAASGTPVLDANGNLSALPGNAPTNYWFVNDSRPDDSGSGLKPSLAKKTIQASVTAAASGDTIIILGGTYAEAVNSGSKNLTIVCVGNVTLAWTDATTHTPAWQGSGRLDISNLTASGTDTNATDGPDITTYTAFSLTGAGTVLRNCNLSVGARAAGITAQTTLAGTATAPGTRFEGGSCSAPSADSAASNVEFIGATVTGNCGVCTFRGGRLVSGTLGGCFTDGHTRGITTATSGVTFVNTLSGTQVYNNAGTWTGSITGDVGGKVLGGGASTITGTGARVVDASGNNVATASALATLQTSVNNLNNLSALANLFGPTTLEIPDSGSTAFPFRLVVRDAEGHLADLSGTPTVAVANAAGTDRSANASSVTHTATGVYDFTYIVASNAAKEGLVFTVSGTAAGDSTARLAVASVAVSDVDQSTAILDIQAKTTDIHNKLPASGNNIGDATESSIYDTNAQVMGAIPPAPPTAVEVRQEMDANSTKLDTAATRATNAATSAAQAVTNTADVPGLLESDGAGGKRFKASVLTQSPAGEGGGNGGGGDRGPGADRMTLNFKKPDTTPVVGARVWLTLAADGTQPVSEAYPTDDAGDVWFLITDGATYYLWVVGGGAADVRGKQITAVKD